MKVLVKSNCCNANVSPNGEEECLNCQMCGKNLGKDKKEITVTEIKEEDTWDFKPKHE